MGNELWSFSLTLYAAEGVEAGALAVQDEMGLDVNMILYASWLASRDQKLTPAHLAGLDKAIGQWRQRVVIPLREQRRQLANYPEAAVLREGIKALELQSERHQQDVMWNYYTSAAALPVVDQPLRDNLKLLLACVEPHYEPWLALNDSIARTLEC
jgi:uncharacterized protein (TIGR02444 family)